MSNNPRHIAIIMDGNGRWAQKRGLVRFEGHSAGIESVRTVIQCCLDNKIPILSLFTFSSENWLRPKQEVDFLMQLFLGVLKQEVQGLHKNGICVRFIGDRESLSPAIQNLMTESETLTTTNKKLILNFALNYGGKWDILQAMHKIAKEVQSGNLKLEEIDESLIQNNLVTETLPTPDLLIRTSGEWRISNFFLWQLAYTELYFTETLWPDFNKEEFTKALMNFRERERRFGKTSRQLQKLE